MAIVVRQVPFRPFETHLAIPDSGETVKILHRQIVLWVSVSLAGQTDVPVDLPKFPAILYIGLNESFAISREHLRRWSGIAEDDLDPVDEVLMYGKRVVARDADIWIHRRSLVA